MSKVFVYGTLLRGFGNHVLLHDATYLGEATTEPEFKMVSLGGFPGVYPGGETAIKGEVYEITESTESRLDGLEGVNDLNPQRGLYRKEYIDLEGYGETLIYIYNTSPTDYPHDMVESGSWREYTNRYYRHG